MRASSRLSLSLLALAATVALASGCTETTIPSPTHVPTPSASPTPSPSRGPSATQAESQPRYDEAVAKFPYALPRGYAFPEEVPSVGRSQEWLTGAKPAFQYWACANVDAAWDRADEGRRDEAEALFRAVGDAKVAYPEYLSEFDSTVPFWDGPYDRTSGESGLCRQWLEVLADAS